jgi:hypothetical protein
VKFILFFLLDTRNEISKIFKDILRTCKIMVRKSIVKYMSLGRIKEMEGKLKG